MENIIDINKIFIKASNYVQSGMAKKQFPNQNELSNDYKLHFYGLFKVATLGTNTTAKPGFFDFVGKAKWDSWTKLSNKTKNEAKKEYIKLLNNIAPGWQIFYDSNIYKN